MKIQTKSWLKSLVSLVLCLSMVLCTPLMAFAAEIDEQTNEKQTIVYVSLGDSMTNGYCLEGYDGTSGAVNYGIETYSNKFAAYLAGYKGKIKDDQVIFEGEDRIVDHRQLAISGLRAQDIQWILELKYTNDTLIQNVFNFKYDGNGFNETTWYDTWGFNADRYTWSELCDYDYRYADAAARILSVYHGGNGTGYFTSSYASEAAITKAINGIKANPYYPEGKDQTNEIGGYKYLQIATEFYQESVKDADIISLAVGNTNFGTHMLSNIVDVIMANDYSFSKDYNTAKLREKINSNDNKDYVNEKINVILNSDNYQTMLDMCKSLANGNSDKEAEIAKIVEYCMIAYINGYIGMLDAILKVNPDVEIIQIPLMNAYEGDEGVIEPDTLGELAEIIYTPVNDLLENLLPDYIKKYEEANFYLSKDVYVSCMVDVFGDDFYKDADGNFVTYPGPLDGTEGYTPNKNSVVRDRFVEEIACGSLIFASMDLLPPDPENPTPKMQKKNYSANVKNFLYGGEVEGVDGYKYNGIGAANYDLLTDTQKAAYAAENPLAAKEYALYLAFEYSLILSGTENVTMDALANLSNIQTIFMDRYADILGEINAAVPNYFEAAAPVVAAGSDGLLSPENIETIMSAHIQGTEEAMNMAVYSIIAEIANGKISEVMGSESELSISLDGNDVKNLYESESFEDAVYELISEISADYSEDGKRMLTPEQVKILVNEEDGVWIVASQFMEKNTGDKISPETIKNIYGTSLFPAEYKPKIELLFTVREGVLKFLEFESTFKDYVALLHSKIPTIVESTSTLAYLLAIPNSMGNALFEDSNLQGALCMNARCLLGTGAGGHPSVGGHQSLYESIYNTFNQEINYKWSEDYSTCTASRGKYATETVNSTSKITTPADCQTVGEITYTAKFEAYWAATQTKTEDIPVTDHVFGETIADPEWTWTENYEASAVFACPVCGEPVEATGVAVSSETTVEPDCRNEGKLVYTATVEFKGQTFTDSKDKVLEKIEHNYGEDGRCQNTLTNGDICGEYNLAQYGQCTPTVSAELVSGSTLTMLLDGNNVGEFTFTETESGWTIANAEGKYLASDANGNLVLSDSAYGWNYSDGKFSTTVKVPGTSWIEQLLGLTKDATYYLAYSEEAVVVASSGSAVTFSTTKDNGYHTFGEINVVDPTCTEKGYTERTCSVCGEVFKTNEVEELGHSYVDTVVPPKCGVEGYTEHKCACGDSYTDTIVPALEHDFSGKNDTCIHCGISDVAVYGECEFKTEASLSDGTYTLSLGGTDVGVYTFSAVSGGYTIKDSDGKYLSVDSNGNLVRSESEFTWTYSNGKFSASVGKASTNWLEALFGGNKKTTYYLAASGSDVTVSSTGAEAKFYIAGKAETHTFEEAYVEPECGVDGYTEFTCTVCGDKFTKEDEGSALEHDYVLTGTVEVTCLTDGYSVYTCSKCGDTYNDDFVTASGSHNFGEDGTCQNVLPNGVCGEPDEPECVYDKEQTLVSGNTYELTLGGKSVGEYTFNSVEGGWSIMNSDGKYLALEDGKLVVSDSAFAWTYSNGRFSSSSSSGTTGIEWLDAILGGKKSTYYLVSSGNTAAVSTSNSSASAKFIAEVTGEHNYSKAKPVDGNHVSVCSNCGYEKTEICNDDNCVLCNASVNVSVSVTKSEPTHWLEILLGGGSSSYKASITTVANGTEVTSVEYSLNGTTWTKGTSFTSKTEISSFSIRVNADNGLTYNYIYSNGSVEFVG